MAFGGFTAAAAKVVLGIENEQFNAGLHASEAQFAQAAASMGGVAGELAERQLRASVAADRYTAALRKYGPATIEARAALAGLVGEQRKLIDIQAAGTGSALRFERGLIAGTARGLGFGRALVFASNAFLGGAGFVYAIHSAIEASTHFQGEMRLLQTQALATSGEVTRMSKAVLGLSGPLATTPIELSKGLYRVESAGLRGARAINVLTTATKGARIGHADLEATTNALIATERSRINVARDGVNTLGRAMATIDAIVGIGNMRMEDLTRSLSSGVIPAAKQFGISLQEVGAALATLTVQGQPAELSATRLRYTIALLGASTPKAEKELRQLGIQSGDVARKMRTEGLIPALELLDRKLKTSGLTIEDQNRLLVRAYGGGRSSTTVLTLIQNLDQLSRRYAKLQKEGTQERFNMRWLAQTRTAEFAFARLRADAERTKIYLGDALRQPAIHAADAISDWLEKSRNQVRLQHDVAQGFKYAAEAGHAFGQGLHQIAEVVHLVDQLLGGTGKSAKLLLEAFLLFKARSFLGAINHNFLDPIRDLTGATRSAVASMQELEEASLQAGAEGVAVRGGSLGVAETRPWRQVDEQRALDAQARADSVAKAKQQEAAAEQKTAIEQKKAVTQEIEVDNRYLAAVQRNAKLRGVTVTESSNQQVRALERVTVAKQGSNSEHPSRSDTPVIQQQTEAIEAQTVALEANAAAKQLAYRPVRATGPFAGVEPGEQKIFQAAVREAQLTGAVSVSSLLASQNLGGRLSYQQATTAIRQLSERGIINRGPGGAYTVAPVHPEYAQAERIVVSDRSTSARELARRLRVSEAEAQTLLAQLAQRGVIEQNPYAGAPVASRYKAGQLMRDYGISRAQARALARRLNVASGVQGPYRPAPLYRNVETAEPLLFPLPDGYERMARRDLERTQAAARARLRSQQRGHFEQGFENGRPVSIAAPGPPPPPAATASVTPRPERPPETLVSGMRPIPRGPLPTFKEEVAGSAALVEAQKRVEQQAKRTGVAISDESAATAAQAEADEKAAAAARVRAEADELAQKAAQTRGEALAAAATAANAQSEAELKATRAVQARTQAEAAAPKVTKEAAAAAEQLARAQEVIAKTGSTAIKTLQQELGISRAAAKELKQQLIDTGKLQEKAARRSVTKQGKKIVAERDFTGPYVVRELPARGQAGARALSNTAARREAQAANAQAEADRLAAQAATMQQEADELAAAAAQKKAEADALAETAATSRAEAEVRATAVAKERAAADLAAAEASQVYYHVAPRSAREAIQREGLRADLPPYAAEGIGNQPGVYLWRDVESAQSWADITHEHMQEGQGPRPDVWRVRGGGLPIGRDQVLDEEAAVFTPGNVPAQKIELLGEETAATKRSAAASREAAAASTAEAAADTKAAGAKQQKTVASRQAADAATVEAASSAKDAAAATAQAAADEKAQAAALLLAEAEEKAAQVLAQTAEARQAAAAGLRAYQREQAAAERAAIREAEAVARLTPILAEDAAALDTATVAFDRYGQAVYTGDRAVRVLTRDEAILLEVQARERRLGAAGFQPAMTSGGKPMYLEGAAATGGLGALLLGARGRLGGALRGAGGALNSNNALGLGLLLTLFGDQPARMLGIGSSGAGRGLTDMMMGAGTGMMFAPMLGSRISPWMGAAVGASFGLKHVIGGAPGSTQQRVGSVVGNVGEGAAVGATLGSVIPGLGTGIGAGVGAAAGLGISLLGMGHHADEAAKDMLRLADAVEKSKEKMRSAREVARTTSVAIANDRVARDEARHELEAAKAQEKETRRTKEHADAVDRLRAAQANYRAAVKQVSNDEKLHKQALDAVEESQRKSKHATDQLVSSIVKVGADAKKSTTTVAGLGRGFGQATSGAQRAAIAADRFADRMDDLGDKAKKSNKRLASTYYELGRIVRETGKIPTDPKYIRVILRFGYDPKSIARTEHAWQELLKAMGVSLKGPAGRAIFDPLGNLIQGGRQSAPGKVTYRNGKWYGPDGRPLNAAGQEAANAEWLAKHGPTKIPRGAQEKMPKYDHSDGSRRGGGADQRPPFRDPSSSPRFQRLETQLAKAQYEGNIAAQRRILAQERRWLVDDLRNARTDAQRQQIYALLNQIKGSLASLDSKSVRNGGVGLIPQRLQDQVSRAEQRGDKRAELAALEKEAAWLRRYLAQPGHSPLEHHKAQTVLTTVMNKIHRLENATGLAGVSGVPGLLRYEDRVQVALANAERGTGSPERIRQLKRERQDVLQFLHEKGHSQAERREAKAELAKLNRQIAQLEKGPGGYGPVIDAIQREIDFLEKYKRTHHRLSLKMRLAIDRKLAQLEKQINTYENKGGASGALLPYQLQISYQKALRTPDEKDDVKALQDEQKFLQAWLAYQKARKTPDKEDDAKAISALPKWQQDYIRSHPGNAKLQLEANKLLTQIDGKLAKLVKTSQDQLRAMEEKFLSELASFWSQFGSNVFTDQGDYKMPGANSGPMEGGASGGGSGSGSGGHRPPNWKHLPQDDRAGLSGKRLAVGEINVIQQFNKPTNDRHREARLALHAVRAALD